MQLPDLTPLLEPLPGHRPGDYKFHPHPALRVDRDAEIFRGIDLTAVWWMNRWAGTDLLRGC